MYKAQLKAFQHIGRAMEKPPAKHQAAVKKLVIDGIDEVMPTFQDIKTKFKKSSDRLQACYGSKTKV